jgi:hypothetical protein
VKVALSFERELMILRAQLIKEPDSEKIKSSFKEKTLKLIPISEQIDKTVNKGKKLDNFQNRLGSK